jgi:putative (di)nucleoside polyphosphate hydrolase
MNYRKNVAAAIFNKQNLLFIGKRKSDGLLLDNLYQLPQGGVDDNESIVDAIFRDIHEETGISLEKLEIITRIDHPIRYDFPKSVIKNMSDTQNRLACFKGQEQYWFFLRFNGVDSDINIFSDNAEFDSWCWGSRDFLFANCVDFKKETYRKVFEYYDSNIC